MHDDISVLRVYQMELCFKSFQIPCRWVPDMGYQYGYPQFEYYGPLPYYVMTAARLFQLPLFDSIKLGFILPLILGNLTMFLLASSLFGNFGGLLSALAYAYAPFRASDLYSRGAMGESWAFIFLPLILFALLSLFKRPTLRKSALLGISFALLFVTHNISTLIFTPMIAAIALVLLFLSREKIKFVKYGFIGMIWAVLISASFFLPVILEKGFAHTESLLSGYFNYLAHFVSLKQLFLTTFWGYGSSEIGPIDDLSFFLGPIQLFLFIVSISVAFFSLAFKKSKLPSLIVFLSAFFVLVSVFMSHEKSTFIWKIIPVLAYLQFPWRFLITANFFLCLSAGYFLLTINKAAARWLLIIFACLVIFFNLSYFRPREWFRLTIWEKFSGLSWDRQLTTSIFDYLPIYAKFPPATGASTLPYSENGAVSILDYRHQSSAISFSTKSMADAKLTLPQFDFPGWRVKLDGKIIVHNHNNDLGLINFEIPQGTHKVAAVLTGTPVRNIADFLSLIFIPLALTVLVKKENKNEKI
ncbi:MAG: hypothetical protein UY10_C0030G0001 [Microgenomates group bacterium GW2011_GWA2_47_8]|nr:MAG: hypothetical protein UY10_C0030G0001 [Microgenomates group bacterium GW2011_GWA2_47_8]